MPCLVFGSPRSKAGVSAPTTMAAKQRPSVHASGVMDLGSSARRARTRAGEIKRGRVKRFRTASARKARRMVVPGAVGSISSLGECEGDL